MSGIISTCTVPVCRLLTKDGFYGLLCELLRLEEDAKRVPVRTYHLQVLSQYHDNDAVIHNKVVFHRTCTKNVI